jgi:hypothetical protein
MSSARAFTSSSESLIRRDRSPGVDPTRSQRPKNSRCDWCALVVQDNRRRHLSLILCPPSQRPRPHRRTVSRWSALGISVLQNSSAAGSPSSSAARDPASRSRSCIAFAAVVRSYPSAATSIRTVGGPAPEVATRNTTRWRRARRCAPRPEGSLARFDPQQIATPVERASPPYSGLNRVQVSARYSCARRTTMDPSPTAEATRFIAPARTSPAANTPGTLVSRGSGSRGSFHVRG